MTHSLHRVGTLENLRNDHTVIVMPAKGINYAGSAEQLRSFVKIAAKYNPANMGLIICGNIYKVGVEEILAKMEERAICAVFDNLDNFTNMLAELKEETWVFPLLAEDFTKIPWRPAKELALLPIPLTIPWGSLENWKNCLLRKFLNLPRCAVITR